MEIIEDKHVHGLIKSSDVDMDRIQLSEVDGSEVCRFDVRLDFYVRLYVSSRFKWRRLGTSSTDRCILGKGKVR